MTTIIRRYVETDTGHRVPNHKSKCKHLHGHRYRFEAEIEGDVVEEKGVSEEPDIDLEESLILYNKISENTKNLMLDKNHDYGEAWREMRVSSLTDLILQKLLRIKQIEDNSGKTLVSEGIDANYSDIINYAVFALIHLEK